MVYQVDVIVNIEEWYIMDVKGAIRAVSESWSDFRRAIDLGYICTKHKIAFTGKRAYKIHVYKEHGY